MKLTIEKHGKDHSLICKSVHQFATDSVDSIRINYYGDVVVDDLDDESLASEELTVEAAAYIDIKGALPKDFIYRFFDSRYNNDFVVKSAKDYPYFSCRYIPKTEECSIHLYKRDSTRLAPDFTGHTDGYHYITMMFDPDASASAANEHTHGNSSEVTNERLSE